MDNADIPQKHERTFKICHYVSSTLPQTTSDIAATSLLLYQIKNENERSLTRKIDHCIINIEVRLCILDFTFLLKIVRVNQTNILLSAVPLP